MSTQCPIDSPSGFVRSGGQARLMSAGNTNFVMIQASVTLCGFGTHKSTTTYASRKYDDTWPKVFQKMVETWTRISDGATSNQTTVCKIDSNNPYKVVTGAGSINIGSVVTTTVTPTLLTITFTDGTFTAQLTGDYIDENSTGAYNPLSGTNGWAYLTGLAKTLLDNYEYQTLNDGYKLKYIGKSSSTVYSYDIEITYENSTMGFVPVAANGFPIRIPESQMGTYGYYPMTQMFSSFQTISEDALRWSASLLATAIQCGACVCAKSYWILAGNYPSTSLYPQTNNHKTIYAEELILDGTTGDFSLGSIVNATGVGTNPITPPVARGFIPEQIVAHGYTFGLFGFRSANA